MKSAAHLRNMVVENQNVQSNTGGNREILIGKLLLRMFFCVLVTLVSSATYARDSIWTSGEWFSDWRYRSGDKKKTLEMPYESVSTLRKLDELGVFPMPNSSIKERAQKWVNDNIAPKSKYYLKTLPKSNLKKDKILKQRQDFLENKLGEIRKEIEEAYSRCEIYKLPQDRFDEIAKCYTKCVATRAWKDVGVSKKSFQEILDKMLPLCKLRNEIYVDIIAAQKVWFQELSLKNPAAANVARDRAEINRLKAKVADAEAAAGNARAQAQWAQAAANAARNEAAEARENANRANAKLRDNGIW